MHLEKKEYGAKILSPLVVTISLYLLLWQLLDGAATLPDYFYGRLMEALGMGLFILLACTVPMKFEKMGIATPRPLLFRSLGMGALLSALFLGALLLLRLSLGLPLVFSWHIRGDISRATYFAVAPLQEVLAKSVMLYGFELALGEQGQRANLMAALTFAAFHVVYGIRMMLAAFALSFVTGLMFQCDRAVWGPALLHFCCGFFPRSLGF